MNGVTTYRNSLLAVNAFDPTKTLTLRNSFVRSVNRRFRELITVIRKAIIDEDCFGLTDILVQTDLVPPGYKAFNFPRTSDKVDGFMNWLRRQIDKGLLETSEFQRVGQSLEGAWTNVFIQDSYKRGLIRARSELRKGGYAVPSIEESGGVEALFGSPFHVDRVGALYTRVFNELRGITTIMENQISEILSQGLIDGNNPNLLARKLVAAIDGTGIGSLDLPISYISPRTGKVVSYVMPAKQRAQTLARTETVRAHHLANIQEYKNWRVEGVTVIAEFVTAGDDRVCAECAGYDGNQYTLEQAELMIPVHPNCRCVVIPIAKIKE